MRSLIKGKAEFCGRCPVLIMMMVMAFFLTACGGKPESVFSTDKVFAARESGSEEGVLQEAAEGESQAEDLELEGSLWSNPESEESLSEDLSSEGSESGLVVTGAPGQEDAAGDENNEPADSAGSDQSQDLLYIHVCGQVKKPGLYRLAPGSRAGDAVDLAGGFTKKADRNVVNLAALLTDGEQVYIPGKSEEDVTSSPDRPAGQETGETDHAQVNINTGDKTALSSLSGIGESRAAAIIEYRNEHGLFSSPEEIRQVPGIGEGIYNKIKDYITV